MNRVAIKLNAGGNIDLIVSDLDVEVIVIDADGQSRRMTPGAGQYAFGRGKVEQALERRPHFTNPTPGADA